MSLFNRRDHVGATAQQLLPTRNPTRPVPLVNNDTAMRHSAVWACLRLRANLISTMPVDAYRRVGGVQVEVPKPPVLVNPGGERVDILEWLYSTQVDLDRGGNCFGIITERNGLNLPSRIDLVPLNEASLKIEKGELKKYRLGGTLYDPKDVWHERAYTTSGLYVGLSPIAYAAWSIGEYLSIQDFALDWFGNHAVPSAHLRNNAKTIDAPKADTIKERFRTSVQAGDVFVTGSDWELKPIASVDKAVEWIEGKKYGISDIARFFDVPGDLIDAEVSTGSITYASITQRNLQLLILHVGPAIIRREAALSKLLSAPRFVKLNSDALLRMDPKARAEMLKLQIDGRMITPSEARELDNRAPYTSAQIAEFEALFGAPRTTPTTATGVPA